MNIADHIAGFTENLEQRNYSPRTVESYVRHAKEFEAFLEHYYPRLKTPNEVTRDVVDDYQSFVRDQRTKDGRVPANTTVRLKLSAIKKLFGHLVERDIVLRDPTTVIVSPKEDQRLTRNVLTQEEAMSVLEAFEPRDPMSTRDRAILELFYACGIRTSELCDLKVSEVDLKDQTVTIVHGKGGKSRIVPIGQYATHYIELYLGKARRHLLRGVRTDPGNLFLSSRGGPLNRETINRSVMGKVNQVLGCEKHVSCYSFRHSVATHLIANGVDIAYVARLLGHESLETTKRYLRIEIGDLKAIHSRFHPRETSLGLAVRP